MVIHVNKNVFNARYLSFLYCMIPTQIFFGGSASGKSTFVLSQRTPLDIIRENRNFLIIRNVEKTIRTSCFNEVKRGLINFQLIDGFDINQSSMVITHRKTGRQIFFRGLDDEEKLKSIIPMKGVITDLIVEEATEISEHGFNQLDLRLRGLSQAPKRKTLLFNPINRSHWIYNRYFKPNGITDGSFTNDNLLVMHSTHEDNKFLTPEDRARIMAYKDIDQFYYDVYALGKWGVLGSVIFKNWRIADLSKEREEFAEKYRHGIDFGYADAPAAYVRSARKAKTIYVFDELYVKGATNPALAEMVLPYCSGQQVMCDCAEPKSITELQLCGVYATPCSKPRFNNMLSPKKSSVLFGIQWLQQHEIVIDNNCQNFINEISVAKWKQDKDGTAMPVPVKINDHLLDALRYAYEDDMLGGDAFVAGNEENYAAQTA